MGDIADDYSEDVIEDEDNNLEEYEYSDTSEEDQQLANFVLPDGGYKIMDYIAVVPMLESLLSDVSSVLDVDVNKAQILLIKYHWDKERLIEKYCNNPSKVLAEFGLDDLGTKPSSDTDLICRICCEEYTVSNSYCLGCGHIFCSSCYSTYLRNLVAEGPSCIKASCPEHKCKHMVLPTGFEALLGEEDFKKYKLYITKNYIDFSKHIRWCPAPGCDKVALGSGITVVRCSCSYCFCFRCGEEAHDPASCDHVKEWNEKCSNESETANWILANTKKCPECHTRIEKNQGCNHMNCKLCKHEFCWICMGSWAEHGATTGGYYRCNRYDAGKIDSSASAAEKAKAELDRYLHYYQRFHGHDGALRFAARQREQAEKRMVEIQESEKSSWIDVQYLKHAVEQVIDCRRVLKYTYVFGYFLVDGSAEKQLFEHHQEMLEKNTERLSEYTEMPLETLERTQVINLTRVTERFMNSLLTAIMDGSSGTGGSRDGHSVTLFTGLDENDHETSASESNTAPAAPAPARVKAVKGSSHASGVVTRRGAHGGGGGGNNAL